MDLYELLFRGHTLMRGALLLIALVINAVRLPDAEHPWALLAISLLMVVITVAAAWCYASAQRRRSWVLATDVSVTVVMIAMSVPILGAERMTDEFGSVIPFWGGSAALVVALWRGWLASLLAAGVTIAADMAVHPLVDANVIGESAVFLLACLTLSWFTSQLRNGTRERERMFAIAAAMAERQRLARIVHDGALQVLAMVEREGPALGPRGVQLARAAHVQEAQLRALLQDPDVDVTSAEPVDVTSLNLAALIDRQAKPGVTISAPAGSLMIEAARAREINAAVSEALSNVAKHAGPNAQAWVLLEREGEDLIISIRDNGVGAREEEFSEAASRGRMGVSRSIYARLADLGGSAQLWTAPGRGTEWEFKVPVSA